MDALINFSLLCIRNLKKKIFRVLDANIFFTNKTKKYVYFIKLLSSNC